MLQVVEGLLVLGVGEAPGDVLVVADQHHRRAWDADAAHVVARRIHRKLVPDRRQGQMQVRVAGHERAAAGASRPGYGPVVARAAAGYETWGQGDKALINVFSGDRLGIRYLRHRSDGC